MLQFRLLGRLVLGRTGMYSRLAMDSLVAHWYGVWDLSRKARAKAKVYEGGAVVL